MGAIEVFNRVEKKYRVPADVYPDLIKSLKRYMSEDAYCKNSSFYSICNIYFDTDNNELIRNSIQKPVYKEKLRLRSYGIPKEGDFLFLEIKKKFKGIVNKRRILLTFDEAKKFMQTMEVPLDGEKVNKQVAKELRYFIDFYDVKPKLFLAYDRMALFGKDNSDIRITLDKNIRTRRDNLSLIHGDEGEMVLDNNDYLMEIKVINSMPLWLTDIISAYEIKNVSFSKYGTEYTNYIKRSRFLC